MSYDYPEAHTEASPRRPQARRIPLDAATPVVSSDGESTITLLDSTKGARSLSVVRLQLLGGTGTSPRSHEQTETTWIVISGYGAVLWGLDMKPLIVDPGDLVHIPAQVPYVLSNLSHHSVVLALLLHANPNPAGDTQPQRSLGPLSAARIDRLRIQHMDRLMRLHTDKPPPDR